MYKSFINLWLDVLWVIGTFAGMVFLTALVIFFLIAAISALWIIFSTIYHHFMDE